jgi:hypothetical protein
MHPLSPTPMARRRAEAPVRLRTARIALVFLALVACGCDGDDGGAGAPGPPGLGPPPSRDLPLGEPAPGIVARVVGVAGGSLGNGAFSPGDHLSVRFELEQQDGTPWDVAEMDTARALVSGPTFNYQRVLAEVSDVAQSAVHNSDGTWTYTFASPLPAAYLPPLNDSPDLGLESGELTGQALLDGTYTVGIYFAWDYTVGGVDERDAGDATFDFVLGASATLEPREVVTTEHCNRCHDSLRFHGGQRRATTLCLLCHTAGAEDRPSAQDPTPGATIDFRVMVHKIHNGGHLPSVHGVTTDASGARDYSATPMPYRLVGFNGSVHDYSEVEFPAWPNVNEPMPRDLGYTALGSSERAQEDTLRGGVTSCYLCHGDPDGDGPLAEPAQGELAYHQPSRAACASCHDDWLPEHPYTANGATMPAQLDDATCRNCHTASGSSLSVRDGHLHPLLDPRLAQGANLELVSVDEAGTHDGDGRIDVGERLTFTFWLRDDAGGEILPSELSQLNATLIGPTTNMQMLESAPLPLALLTGPQPFTIPLPSRVALELVGVDAPGLQTFTTARSPHLDVVGASTDVFVVDGFGPGSSTLSTPIEGPVNYIDVMDGSSFARDMFVVIADGAPDAEYLRVQLVEDDRLWFGSPAARDYPIGPTVARPVGTQVRSLLGSTRVSGTDYSVVAASGEVTELIDFGNSGPVLVGYSTEFVMPAVYPVTLNAGPDLGEAQGGWTGKPVIDGTYRLTVWGRRDLNVMLQGETNSYRERFEGEALEFLGGDATVLEPYEPITDRENCYACHVTIAFHGRSRIGFDTCVACHAVSAAGDRPRYVAADAPPTDGVTINFRELIHKLHMGADLENAGDYIVNGFGSGSYPGNFASQSFEHIHFPAFPDGVKACATCHGADSDAWLEPQDTNHPTVQATPGQPWSLVCGSCHDGASAAAHIASQISSSGAESCSICHGEGRDLAVEPMHLRR